MTASHGPAATTAAASANGSSTDEVSLENAFKTFMEDEELWDLRLKGSDGIIVGASRGLLAARSKVFRSMLFGSFSESSSSSSAIDIGYPSIVLRSIVQYCLTNEAALLASNVADVGTAKDILTLADAAVYFDLHGLKGEVQDKAFSLMAEKSSLACLFLEGCQENQELSEIEQNALEVIRSNPAGSLLQGDAVAGISRRVLHDCILTDRHIMATEITLFKVLQAWVNGGAVDAVENRRQAALELSSAICLERIKPSDLSAIVEPSGLVPNKELFMAYKAQANALDTEENSEKRKSFERVRSTQDGMVWEYSGTSLFSHTGNSWNSDAIQNDATCLSGIWKWLIKIEKMDGRGSDLTLGVLSTRTSPSLGAGYCFTSNSLAWGYRGDGRRVRSHHTFAIKSSSSPLLYSGAVVEFTLDLTQKGSLKVSVDGSEPSLVFDNIKQSAGKDGFLPAVSATQTCDIRFLQLERVG